MQIAIDLIPLLSGGSNGGAKIMSLQLIKNLAKLSPTDTFILIGTKQNIKEITTLTTQNVRAVCISSKPRFTLANILIGLLRAILQPIWRLIKNVLPRFARIRLTHTAIRFRSQVLFENIVKFVKADLLFCPFTAPLLRQLNIPIVSVIYDLQSHYYPYFFTHDEQYERKKNFEEACHWANKLVCISDFVKQTVLDNSKITEENVKTIHIQLAHRLPQIDPQTKNVTLNKYQLIEQEFLLFPANFWVHKNHQMLFTAFNIYQTQNPTSKLKLVCTGADSPYKTELLDAVKKMGLSSRIILPGYLSDKEFSSLVSGCLAVIFPSLYEGFGMPVLEAMAANKPVLCSNLTSLPEIAGNAALLFDPRKPQDIVNAIYRIEHEAELRAHLIKLGQEHMATFGTEANMARKYLDVFQSALKENGTYVS